MTTPRTYPIEVTADDNGGWSVAALGRVSHANRIRDVADVATTLIALVENVSPDDIALDLHWPPRIAELLAAIGDRADLIERSSSEILVLRRELITDLRTRNEKYDDIAALLNLSRSRVQTIAETPHPPTSNRTQQDPS